MSRLLALSARRFAAPAAAAACTFLHASKARAEEENTSDDTDPFANLPVEDERTSCSICLVNRQGPCRDPWRRFELCLKSLKDKDDENSKSEDKAPDAQHSSAACDVYMMPWLTCIQSYRNLYTLYFNYMNQLELIEPLEKEIREDEVYEWEDVNAEWTPYVDWLKQKGYTLWDLYWRLKQTASPVAQRPKYEGGEDPELLEILVKVPLEEKGLPIQVAYAKDQGGLLLGMEHFVSDKEENAKEGTLKISFQPGSTSAVYLFALYKQEKGDDARFLCSLPQPLLIAAMEDGGIEEGEF